MNMLCWFGVGGCCRKIVARPDNLAQASQSRLGEMNRDSPKPFYAKGHSGDQLNFWASEHLAQVRGVSPKRDPAWAPASFLALAQAKGARRARPFSLSEELGETLRLCGYFWNSKLVYACLGVDYSIKCVRQINMHEWCDPWILNDGFGLEPSHVKGMRWLVLNWHGIGMRWNSTMLVENDELEWIHWKIKRDGLWRTSMRCVCINLYDESFLIGWACLVRVSA